MSSKCNYNMLKYYPFNANINNTNILSKEAVF